MVVFGECHFNRNVFAVFMPFQLFFETGNKGIGANAQRIFFRTAAGELFAVNRAFVINHDDVAVFHLMDRQEYNFDFTRPIRFVDMETGMDLITDPTVLRDAYREAANPARWAEGDPEASLAARTSPGAAADLRLDALRARLDGA